MIPSEFITEFGSKPGTPTMSTTNGTSRGLLDILGVNNLLNTQAAAGFFSNLATRGVNSGRAPGLEQFDNPTQPARGSAGQPGTTPDTTPTVLQQLMPWAIFGGVALLALVVIKFLFRR